MLPDILGGLGRVPLKEIGHRVRLATSVRRLSVKHSRVVRRAAHMGIASEEHEHWPDAKSDPKHNEPPNADVQNLWYELRYYESEEHRGPKSKLGVDDSEPSGTRIKVLPECHCFPLRDQLSRAIRPARHSQPSESA